MSDIVQRLRTAVVCYNDDDEALFAAAADEIESLRSRLADKQKLLDEAIKYGDDYKQQSAELMLNYQTALLRLAETEALLREARTLTTNGTGLAVRIDAHLSRATAPPARTADSASVNHWQCLQCGWMNTEPYCPCTAEPDVTCATHGCTYRDGTCIRCWSREAVIISHEKAIDSLLDDCATVYGGPFTEDAKCNHFPGQVNCEWCSAPTLQPCGHPWKAQHDFKCILCSSPCDATSAQLAEAQRFLHSAPASASGVQYKPCEICTTQSWCETHGCQCYPVSAVQPERCCLDYPRCDCNSPPESEGAE